MAQVKLERVPNEAQQTSFTLQHFYHTKNTMPKILDVCQFSWKRAVQLEAKMDDEAFVLYLLRKTFHKI